MLQNCPALKSNLVNVLDENELKLLEYLHFKCLIKMYNVCLFVLGTPMIFVEDSG